MGEEFLSKSDICYQGKILLVGVYVLPSKNLLFLFRGIAIASELRK